jgi:hypothetical protein
MVEHEFRNLPQALGVDGCKASIAVAARTFRIAELRSVDQVVSMIC